MITTRLAVELIDPPSDPSRIDGIHIVIEDLMPSLRSIGLVNPIIVKPTGDRYEIVAGHRRWLAARAIGWAEIDAKITTVADETRDTQVRIAENIQRIDLSPIEEAREIGKLLEISDHDLTIVADIVNRSLAWCGQRAALLHLQDDLAPLVHSRELAMSAALKLMTVAEDASRKQLTSYVIAGGANTNTITQWVNSYHLQRMEHPDQPPTMPPLPTPGERAIVTLPCHCCRQPFNHLTMRVLRTCQDCADIISGEAPPPIATVLTT